MFLQEKYVCSTLGSFPSTHFFFPSYFGVNWVIFVFVKFFTEYERNVGSGSGNLFRHSKDRFFRIVTSSRHKRFVYGWMFTVCATYASVTQLLFWISGVRSDICHIHCLILLKIRSIINQYMLVAIRLVYNLIPKKNVDPCKPFWLILAIHIVET